MTAGVVGLGLIGGSFAKAWHEAGHRVLGWNRTRAVLDFALMSGEVDAELTKENIAGCDLVLVCLPPEAAIRWVREWGEHIGPGPLVIDCCATKRVVCAALFPEAQKDGFTYVGGHPMAGTQYAGYKYAKADMFRGAPMVIVPPVYDDIAFLSRIKLLLQPAGFSRISVTTADKHDAMIAYTSQMAHVVSNAYIKSPSAGEHKGISADSFEDLTRVAGLNPPMWAELFLENRDCLLFELNTLIGNLNSYKEALERNDRDGLIRLLEEGRKRKEEVDGR